MGEHKHNPTAIAAKNGELPPKPKKLSKREVERLAFQNILNTLPQLPIYDYYTRTISKGA